MDVFLKKLHNSWISPLAIRAVPRVGEDTIAAKLSAPESLSVSLSAGGLAQSGSGEASSGVAGKDEKAGARNDGARSAQRRQLYRHSRQ
jgi:hypothetical protein